MEKIKEDLNIKGYAVIEDILTQDEIYNYRKMFFKWKEELPYHDYYYNNLNSNGIYKFHQIGHQEFAWYIKTNPKIIDIFKNIWNTTDLVSSFDGCCYMPKDIDFIDTNWTHVDQSPNKKNLECYQGLVSLTDNKERTFVVYESSHKLFDYYFKSNGIKSDNNWQIISKNFLDSIKGKKRVLNIKAGSLLIWDSRTFHQNQFGKPNSEERLVQYVCYLPKNDIRNSQEEQRKRKLFFEKKITTTHWPYPITPVHSQPEKYGYYNCNINYDLLRKPNLESYLNEIKKLL